MGKQVLLDAGPLGMISHPRPNKAIANWLKRLLASGAGVLVPEIADDEVRRELLRAGKHKGIQRLDDLHRAIGYIPLSTAAMLKAAEFWATARNAGYPTAADKALNVDVILAAQDVDLAAERGIDVVIATANIGHLSRFADARRWDEISEADVT